MPWNCIFINTKHLELFCREAYFVKQREAINVSVMHWIKLCNFSLLLANWIWVLPFLIGDNLKNISKCFLYSIIVKETRKRMCPHFSIDINKIPHTSFLLWLTWSHPPLSPYITGFVLTNIYSTPPGIFFYNVQPFVCTPYPHGPPYKL